jgi:hypothetical protein
MGTGVPREAGMSDKAFDEDIPVTNGPQSILERALVAEYLIGKGYLISDLKNLDSQLAKRLMLEACQFAALRLAEIESRVNFQQKIRLTMSLN